MKYGLFIPLAATVFVASSFAQTRIYRCGNEYTNTVPDAQAKGCKLVEGGNVTVIQGGPRLTAPKAAASGAPDSGSTPPSSVHATRTPARFWKPSSPSPKRACRR